MNIQDNVAYNLKEIRKKKQLTLDEASRLTGVSRSMLSAIEKGESNPTITVLWKIAHGYKVQLSALIENKRQRSQVIPGETIMPETAEDGRYVCYQVFSSDEKRLFETYRIRIDQGCQKKSQPHMPGTEEYITVFYGSVEITAREDSFILHAGDSLMFNADMDHSYRNIGTGTAWLSIILYYRPL